MFFEQIFEEKLAQYAYLIGCQKSGEAVVIDPMRDIDRYNKLAAKHGLTIVAAAETHIHADYISGLREFAARGVKVYADIGNILTGFFAMKLQHIWPRRFDDGHKLFANDINAKQNAFRRIRTNRIGAICQCC